MIAVSQPLDGEVARGGITVEITNRESAVPERALCDEKGAVRYRDGYALTRSFALERLRYGNHNKSASYVHRIRAVTKEDVLDAARKYLRPENMQTVLFDEEAFSID